MGNKYVVAIGSAFQGMTLMGPFDSYGDAVDFANGSGGTVPILNEWEAIEIKPVVPQTIAERDNPATGEPDQGSMYELVRDQTTANFLPAPLPETDGEKLLETTGPMFSGRVFHT